MLLPAGCYWFAFPVLPADVCDSTHSYTLGWVIPTAPSHLFIVPLFSWQQQQSCCAFLTTAQLRGDMACPWAAPPSAPTAFPIWLYRCSSTHSVDAYRMNESAPHSKYIQTKNLSIRKKSLRTVRFSLSNRNKLWVKPPSKSARLVIPNIPEVGEVVPTSSCHLTCAAELHTTVYVQLLPSLPTSYNTPFFYTTCYTLLR